MKYEIVQNVFCSKSVSRVLQWAPRAAGTSSALKRAEVKTVKVYRRSTIHSCSESPLYAGDFLKRIASRVWKKFA